MEYKSRDERTRMTEKNILLSAYACAPNIGSEYEAGWQWSLSAAEYFNTWVLTKTDNKEQIEAWCSVHEKPERLHFVYVDIPKTARKTGGRVGVLIKYESWQWKIIKIAKQLHKEHRFFFVHHLTFASLSLPVFLYRLRIPLVIGPAGGGERIPDCIGYPLTNRERRLERQRRLMQRLPQMSIVNQLEYARSSLILCATQETKDMLPKRWHIKTAVMPIIGIRMEDSFYQKQLERIRNKKDKPVVRILMAGRATYWKGYQLGINAVQGLLNEGYKVCLEILGGG